MHKPTILFHFDLIQDVAVLRPLAFLAANRDEDRIFLVSPNFLKLDRDEQWAGQIARLATETGASIVRYESEFDVVKMLVRRRGLCIAGSESNARAHQSTHQLFRALPAGFTRITLQHGFECIGFLHNARHTASLGRDIMFAADIIIGWFDKQRLVDVSPRQLAKLYVAGPVSMIAPRSRASDGYEPYCGVACENTHSVRFASARIKQAFLRQMENLAARLARIDTKLNLRPHPAGMFLDRSGYTLPGSMAVLDGPLFDIDLSVYSFAMSAPSTILFDFVLAGVPTAIWGAEFGLDAQNFTGLRELRGAKDCWQFAIDSVLRREAILAEQQAFLGRLGIPGDVPGRYASLLALANS
jgi:hypothetical protein